MKQNKKWDFRRNKKNNLEEQKIEKETKEYTVDETMEMDEWLEPEAVTAGKEKPEAEPEQEKVRTKKDILYSIVGKCSILLFLLLACLLNFFIESVSRYSFVKAYEFFAGAKEVFLYNSFLIFTTLTIAYMFRRRVFATMIIGGLWMTGGIANGAVLSYRTTPFTGTDMKLIKSAMDLVQKYMSLDQMIFTIVMVILVLVLFVYTAIRSPKFKGKMHYIRNGILVALTLLSIIPVTKACVDERVLSTYFGNIAIAYEDYGFPYCFWCTVLARGIDCPNEYDESRIKEILNQDGQDSYQEEERPNIIFIQLESFFDPSTVKGLEMSQNPIPNFTKLEKNFSHGYLTVPVVGAGTANTEFEVLTGMSLRYFGPGEYPYKTIMKKNVCESVAYNLDSIGYTSHAIHNNVASFYGRKSIFTRLGFNSFTSEELMNITDYTSLGWSKDAVLTESIMDCLKSTDGSDFVYTITVQSHGGYPSEPALENPVITVSGRGDEASINSKEYYVNQIYEVDQFIGSLVQELSNYDEDTVVVLFGDHLPSLALKESDLTNNSLYETPYVIWDNMDLPKRTRDLTSYQLAAATLDRVDIHVGTLMKAHQTRMGTRNYYQDLEMLQYDMLYGKKYMYGGETPFERVAMTMGVADVTISGVYADKDRNLLIKGDNFTAFSKLRQDGEDVETVFIDEHTLSVTGLKINKRDTLRVDQLTTTGKKLRKGITYSLATGQNVIEPTEEALPDEVEEE